MKKLLFLSIMAVLISGCTGTTNTLTEESALPPPITGGEVDAIERINDLRMGKKPVVAPSKKTQPVPPMYDKTVPPPPSDMPPQSIPPITNSSAATMPDYEDLTRSFHKAVIKTNYGEITVNFYHELSPITVNNFMNLAKQGFYDGTRFHRVITDFMIQGGDPLSKDNANQSRWGTGGPGYKFADEFNDRPLQKGSLAMANSGANTNGSQFFIVTKDFTPWLDGKHTNFGFVEDGMDTVDTIESLPVDANDRPLQEAVIESIELLP